MEIIMISNNKLKIMLCEKDLDEFELKADQLDYSTTETKRMFWDILNKAKHETGFDTDGQRVLVQLYPSKEGGCEMFVTKVGHMTSLNSKGFEAAGSKSNGNCFINSNNEKIKNLSYSIFSFKKTEDMLNVCKRLDSLGYIGDSSAYTDETGQKYLILSDVDYDYYTPADELTFILEYANYESKENLIYYLTEHGSIICDTNAVPILSRL